ncbi:Gfo/Idh/MocA family protein [Brevibacterium sp. UCMA 11752]|uniref:Gfo/Idh/MocA family protein n=1 Tax=Brevibacterium sp. UCMA 11752 TaxID=2745946 RepID=UPI001F1AA63E|nr:Gfo/Idh/MocA family oxidoreductase [Brevibacterium sp. UCMA 11752]MCF2586340.1 Gfo/Idh/MocA family oxidoreductase [Brevibacterium sp. UCMA 11752]
MDTVAQASAPPPRIGMVGGGFMARTHTRAARAAGAHLEVIARSSAAGSRSAAAELGYRAAATGDDLFDHELDVVHVCTPNSTHAEYSRRALDSGSHIICEKPLAVDAATARSILEHATSLGLGGTVPFVYRYHPMVREARARIRRGDAGALLTIDASYLQDWMLSADDDNWRVDAGSGGPSRAFADIGSHLVDLIEFITDERIVSLVATTRTVHSRRGGATVTTEDTVAMTVEMSGGGIGSVLISQLAPGRKNSLVIEVAGSKETLRFAQEQPEELWVGSRGGSLLLVRDPEVLSADAARLCRVPAGHPQGYQDAFNAFVADSYAVFAGEEREGVPILADGVRAAFVTEAVLKSAAERTWVEVEAP